MRVSNHDVLIVVDVQNDFCSGGAPAVPGGEKVVPAINCIAQKFQNVMLTQDWHPQDHVSFASNHAHKHPYDTVELSYGSQVLWPDHCVQGSAGAEFHRSLDTARAGLCAAQGNPSRDRLLFRALRNDNKAPTGLAGYLRERGWTTLFFAGLAFDFCVLCVPKTLSGFIE